MVHSTVFAFVVVNYEIKGRLYRGKLPLSSHLRIASLPAQMSRFLTRIILPVILRGFLPSTLAQLVECVWNVMSPAQKPDFVFSAKRTSPLKSAGASIHSTTGSRSVRISGSNAGYTVFRGSVKSTGYLLHSPDSPSLPLPCVTVCHHISTGLLTPTYV